MLCLFCLFLKRLASHFMPVEKQFREGWKHPNKPMPSVHAIFRVVMSEEFLRPYKNYRCVPAKFSESAKSCVSYDFNASASVQASLSSKKLHQLQSFCFHGTYRACLVGENQNLHPCSLTECCVCSIIRNSFDMSKCGECSVRLCICFLQTSVITGTRNKFKR